MGSLSVVIITFNEEHNIGRCLDSVSAIADEIIILDSYSNDKTVQIARQRGARVTQQTFAGYIEQKNAALDLATHRYVLCLDADEALDQRLAAEIAREKTAFNFRAYTMNRCTNYCGHFIRHGTWYPDRKLRLFDKTAARWGGVNPHDKIETTEPLNTKRLRGDILHYSYNSIEEHAAQNNKFSSISASSLYRSGKRTNLLKICLNPAWAFLNGYILRLGFLDGFYGYVVAINVAHLTFLKHIKLYQLWQTNSKNL